MRIPRSRWTIPRLMASRLVITAVVFGMLWMFPGLEDTADSVTPHAFHAVVGFLLAAILIVSGLLYGPDAEDSRIDPVSSGALAAYLFCAAVLVRQPAERRGGRRR